MSEERNYEVDARKDGWVPQEDYRGSKDQWVDAKEFVERGEKINPILRANNERLKREIDNNFKKHQAEMDELRQTATDFKKFQKEQFEVKASKYEAELRSLRAARSEATSQEDHEKAAEIEERIDEVKDKVAEAKAAAKAEPTPPPKTEEPLDPSLKEWLDSNKWYGDVDTYLEETEMVTAIGAAIRKKHPSLHGKPFLDMLDEKIEERLPELRPGKKKGPSVESGTRTRQSGSKVRKSYENLPSEAKAACDRFVAQKLMSKEEYVDSYEWSEE